MLSLKSHKCAVKVGEKKIRDLLLSAGSDLLEELLKTAAGDIFTYFKTSLASGINKTSCFSIYKGHTDFNHEYIVKHLF